MKLQKIITIVIMINVIFDILAQLPIMIDGEKNDSIENSIASSLLNKCIKRKRVYSGNSQQVSFDSISFFYIPKYKLDYSKIETLACEELIPNGLKESQYNIPYFILLIKQGRYYGVICTDDCNNSYIDIDYIFKYENMNPLLEFLQINNIEYPFQVQGNDGIIWVYHHKQLRVLLSMFVSEEELITYKYKEYINSTFEFQNASEYLCKPYFREALLQYRDNVRCDNTRRKLRNPYNKIGYGTPKEEVTIDYTKSR